MAGCECPKCAKTLDRTVCLEGQAPPAPGDVSLCLHCGALLRWDDTMRLVPLDPANWRKLDLSQRRLLVESQRQVRIINERKGQPSWKNRHL